MVAIAGYLPVAVYTRFASEMFQFTFAIAAEMVRLPYCSSRKANTFCACGMAFLSDSSVLIACSFCAAVLKCRFSSPDTIVESNTLTIEPAAIRNV